MTHTERERERFAIVYPSRVRAQHSSQLAPQLSGQALDRAQRASQGFAKCQWIIMVDSCYAGNVGSDTVYPLFGILYPRCDDPKGTLARISVCHVPGGSVDVTHRLQRRTFRVPANAGSVATPLRTPAARKQERKRSDLQHLKRREG